LTPRYGLAHFDKEQRGNKWLQIIGKNAVSLHQDVSVHVSELENGNELKLAIESDKLGYIKIVEGSADINGVNLQHGDAAMIENEHVIIKANADAHIMAVKVAQSQCI
jgi:redox-sensitive bicupin YhaK (pirin superfamily)